MMIVSLILILSLMICIIVIILGPFLSIERDIILKSLFLFPILFILNIISEVIEDKIEEKRVKKSRTKFINNKKLFNQVEMKYLEEITKNIDNLSDKYYVYREYYDKRNEEICENMKKIIEQLVEKKEISELSVKLLKSYEKEMNLPEYKKEELRKFFAEKVSEKRKFFAEKELEKELNNIKIRIEEKIKKDEETDRKIDQLIKELEL